MPNSPLNEYDAGEESLKDFMRRQSWNFFVEKIPVEFIKELPLGYMVIFGFVAEAFAIGLFIYFLYTNYVASIDTATISLQSNAGNCKNVSIAVTGTYLADERGRWQVTPGFQYSQAVYSFGFSNFEINSVDQYKQMMTTYSETLELIGKYYSLQENLFLSPNISTIGQGQLQSIQLTGQPNVLYNPEVLVAKVATSMGICGILSDASFDQANNVYKNVYPNGTEFIENAICYEAMNPYAFGYYPGINTGNFESSINIQSIPVALSVNLRFSRLSALRSINSQSFNFTYSNTSFGWDLYYSLTYSMMQPIYCIYNLTELPPQLSPILESVCFYPLGMTIALPIMNHQGYDANKPSYCNCSTRVGKDPACQSFHLMTGLLFYSNPNIESHNPTISGSKMPIDIDQIGLQNIMQLLNKFDSYHELNRAAYTASFVTSSLTYQCNASCMQEAFQFCQLKAPNGPSTNCSIYIFSSSVSYAKTISEYKYQLHQGSCSDSVTISPSAWKNLVENPPVPFYQDYYECYPTQFDTALVAIGVASGNTAIFLPIIVFITLPLIYILLKLLNIVPAKEEYERTEKEGVIEVLSVILLRLRDGKTRGIRKKGLLINLTKELISAAKEEMGYPDSDDEEEDEETDASVGSYNKREKQPKDASLHNKLGKMAPLSIAPSDVNNPHDESERDGSSPVIQVVQPSLSDSNGGRQTTTTAKQTTTSDNIARTWTFAPFHMISSVPKKFSNGSFRDRIVSRGTFRESRQSNTPGAHMTTNYNRQASKFSSFLSGNRNSIFRQTTTQQQEPYGTDQAPELLNLNISLPPSDVIILNAASHYLPRHFNFTRLLNSRMSNQQISLLVEDLYKLFSDLCNVSTNASLDSSLPRLDSMVSEEGAPDRSRGGKLRDSPKYIHAKALTQRLIEVTIESIQIVGEPTLFVMLSNVMCMHASVELECDMRIISLQYFNRVAYNIGGHMVTFNNLQRYI